LKIVILVFGSIAVILGALRGSRLFLENLETERYSVMTIDHYPGLIGHVEHGDQAQDPRYSVLKVKLSQSNDPARHVTLNLIVEGADSVEIREAYERGLSPPGFTLFSSANHDQSEFRGWRKIEGDTYLAIELVGTDEDRLYASIQGVLPQGTTTLQPLLQINGQDLHIPCRRSEIVSILGPPEIERTNIP